MTINFIAGACRVVAVSTLLITTCTRVDTLWSAFSYSSLFGQPKIFNKIVLGLHNI